MNSYNLIFANQTILSISRLKCLRQKIISIREESDWPAPRKVHFHKEDNKTWLHEDGTRKLSIYCSNRKKLTFDSSSLFLNFSEKIWAWVSKIEKTKEKNLLREINFISLKNKFRRVLKVNIQNKNINWPNFLFWIWFFGHMPYFEFKVISI